MRTIQIVEGDAGFEGVVAFAVPAAGLVAVRPASGACELVLPSGSISAWCVPMMTAPTLTEICYRVRVFAPGTYAGVDPARVLDAAALARAGKDIVAAEMAPALLADALEELTDETLVILPKRQLVRTVHTPDPRRRAVYGHRPDPDPLCGATTTREVVDARPGSIVLFFPDGRPLELYPDHESGWTPAALFAVASRLASVVRPKPKPVRIPKGEVARSPLHGVCVYRIGGVVGEHVVEPGDDRVPGWTLVTESMPTLDSPEVLQARMEQLASELEQFGESAQYPDWPAEQRAREHVRSVVWPTLEERLFLARMEAQRLGLDDTKVWLKVDRSRPLSTAKLRDCMKEVVRRVPTIVNKRAPVEGIALLIGQSVFGRPDAADLEHIQAERVPSDPLHEYTMDCDLEPLRPELLGTVAGIAWARRLAAEMHREFAALHELSTTLAEEHPSRPLLIDPSPVLALFPLAPALDTSSSQRATAVFAGLVRGVAPRLGEVALRVTRRAVGVHAADAWAYAVLDSIVHVLGMWRPALVLVPRPFDYLPALIALDNGYRYVVDRKYDPAALGAGLESYIGGKMPAAETA